MAKAIVSLSQQVASVRGVQQNAPQLVVPREISTCWKATYLILVYSLRLKAEIIEWLSTASRSDRSLVRFILFNREWTHVLYPVVLLC